MSQFPVQLKVEDTMDMLSEEEEEEEEEGEGDGFGDGMHVPSQSVQQMPTAPPQAISPLSDQQQQQQQQQQQSRELPSYFHNSGLIFRNSDGFVASNEATLPPEKSFTIQVGPETFRLSGASIMSDAPSYFSRFFEAELAKQNAESSTKIKNGPADAPSSSVPLRTLYIDRDPVTFRDIALHLQGYHIQPRDSMHYVRLFVDAQFYVLPRLVKQLWESEVFIRIGEEEFCIPRDLFDSPGNSPNYFTLGFSLLFAAPGNPFPGLEISGLLRPPAIKSASASGRSGRIFADILDLLRGYEVHIRDEEHRSALLRDCRFYHLRGLEQKIIPYTISWNTQRNTSEITLRLEDLRQSGISLKEEQNSGGLMAIRYQRPNGADEASHELIVETGKDSATIRPWGNSFRVEFHSETKTRIMNLFKVTAGKYAETLAALNGSTPNMFCLNLDGMATAMLEADALVTVDGEEGWLVLPSIEDVNAMRIEDETESGKKRRRLDSGASKALVEHTKEWTVIRSQWRLRVENWRRGTESDNYNYAIHMCAVNLDVVRGQKGRSRRRGFIGA